MKYQSALRTVKKLRGIYGWTLLISALGGAAGFRLVDKMSRGKMNKGKLRNYILTGGAIGGLLIPKTAIGIVVVAEIFSRLTPAQREKMMKSLTSGVKKGTKRTGEWVDEKAGGKRKKKQ